MEIEYSQEDNPELNQINLATKETSTLPALNPVPEGHSSQDGMECKSENKLCKDAQIVDGDSHESGNPTKHEEMEQPLSTELGCSEIQENTTTVASTSPPIILKPEDRMDVAAQLGSLNVRSELTVGQNGKVQAFDQSSELDCHNKCIGVKEEGDEMENEDSSSDSDTDSDSSSSSSSSSLLSVILKVDEGDEPNGMNEIPLKTKDEILLDTDAERSSPSRCRNRGTGPIQMEKRSLSVYNKKPMESRK
ncbi:Hypothetical predicted protein [Pelobates cultripes]|uniref:Uncharacterized protein n=1 Tax=Pelobates cultripes TaxID=61616 RepID=A0AAD1WDG1_PELCU|nr:Hypothetical predicted protein [Pelobates cultripes]